MAESRRNSSLPTKASRIHLRRAIGITVAPERTS